MMLCGRPWAMADFGAAFLAKADLNSAADIRRLRAHRRSLTSVRF
jgi:hypothetical protein